ncbi:MAG: YfhO family protein [Elusimicrobia bacterium]|nr:YfhO family protein [Elusimicrobiota bacterium]
MPGLAACLLLTVLVGAVAFRRYLSFQAAYLFKDIGSDSLNITYPQVLHLFDYLRAEGFPGWSFAQGLGQNLYPSALSDPFFLILLPFGRDGAAFGFAYMELAKVLCAAAFFHLFLREARLSRFAAVAGGLLYAFTGFMAVGSGWSVFSTEAVNCALGLWAFERTLVRGSPALLPPAFALLTLRQPALLWPYALAFSAYGAARFADENGGGLRAGLAFLARCAGWAALGALMSGFSLLDALFQLADSPRVGGGASLVRALASTPPLRLEGAEHYVTALLRLYSSDLLGAGSAFTGWKNYLEAPAFYCGLSSLLLAPQAFCAMSARQRRVYGVLAACAALPAVFPYFRQALWAFSGDYYRSYSLFVAAFLVYLTARALDGLHERGESGPAALFASLALLLVPLAAAGTLDPSLRAGCAAFLCVDAALLFAMRVASRRRAAGVLLLASLCVEAAWFTSVTVSSGRDALTAAELREKKGYGDDTLDAVAYLKAADPSFYRIEKDYRSGPTGHASYNDAKAQGYLGTTSYAQFNQRSYVEFLAQTGVIDPAVSVDSIWLRGLSRRPGLMRLVGVKFFLSKGGDVPPAFAADLVGTFGAVRAFQDRSARPLGFALDRCLTAREFRALDPRSMDAALLDAFVVEDCGGFPRPAPGPAAAPEALSIRRWSHNALEGSVALRSPKLLLFTIPWDAGWSASVDGRPAELRRVDFGFFGVPLEAGVHEVGLRYEPPFRRLGAALSLAALSLFLVLLKKRRPGVAAGAPVRPMRPGQSTL